MSLFARLKKLFADDGERCRVIENPVLHQFPDVGADGEITIDCIVRASTATYGQYITPDQKPDSGMPRIEPHCVGVVFVEVDQYGLHFRWQPRECAEDVFLSPFGRTPFKQPSTRPATEGAQ